MSKGLVVKVSCCCFFQVKWTPPLTAVFQTFAALVDHMSKDTVKLYLKHVCEPMYRVLDESGGLVTRPGDVELGMSQIATTGTRAGH